MNLVLSASSLLRRTVSVHGIRVGHPVDVFFDPTLERAVGLQIETLGDSFRFVPWVACELQSDSDSIVVESPLALLGPAELSFYRRRGLALGRLGSFWALNGGEELGALDDVMLDAEGRVSRLVIDRPYGQAFVERRGITLEDRGGERAGLGPNAPRQARAGRAR